MLTRRIAILGIAPFGLAACHGSLPASQKVAAVARDVDIIAAGLSRTLRQLAVLDLPALTPAVMELCQKALVGIQTVARALSVATDVADAQPLVLRIEGYVSAILAALAAVPLPQDIQRALAAATILLPIVMMAVNLAAPPTVAPMPAVAPMTPEQARTALKS